MRLSTRVHGTIDIVIGLLLVLGPWLLDFAESRGGWTAMLVGIAILLNALVTDFEIGRLRRLEIPVHLWIDGLLGLLLATSPWLFEFDQTVWIPHVVAGVLLIVVALLSNTVPGYDRRQSNRSAAG